MYQNPETKKRVIEQMVGGIMERRAKAKAEVEARKKANDLEAKARAEKENAKSWEDFEVSCIMGKPKIPPFGHDLVVSDDPANESHTLNLVARERLERQISDLIDKANQALKERTFLTRDALDILEMARNTAYTEPMGEVSVTIHEAARRLSDIEPQFGRTANSLGNLAMEIRQSEQAREVSK